MKKTVLLLTAVVLSLFMFSCEDDNDDIHVYSGGTLTYFTETSGNLFVTFDNPSTTIEVVSSKATNSDRTFSVSIDTDISTAVQDVEFTLASNSVTIPAGEYSGTLEIGGLFEGALETGSTLVLNLTGDTTALFDTTYTLGIFKLCDSDLGGTYEVTTTYGFHDFLPDFDVHTQMMDIEDLGDGLYFVQDFSGGLYDGGPYTDNYGTDATSMDLEFKDICGTITWSDQVDPWGDIVPNGTNSVDELTGVITTSWSCTGYGENGVSTYVPQ
ncbi:hypothetical protein [Psychroserpens ponticola]|uniref:DUF1735 domain-containing protein n=1 Tax=Psychroserpens ponticola TaxID=2932268 RepID=A0ABY7RV77_9FLAO|nr:hypothetical protein [Psychroserpens ponticola]WCO01031.1 hypothetical protein MUN68_013275 [Psychroserpens ponticola]